MMPGSDGGRGGSAARWEKVEAVFAEALAVPEAERGQHLDDVCRGDDELRREVEELLSAHAAPGLFDDVVETAEGASGPEVAALHHSPGARIGPYRVEGVLGRGGMGVVYEARRADGQFDLDVALKVLPAGAPTPRLRDRFLAERQILARLSHPNVARLLDGGVDDGGHPYFAMERVTGRPILEHCDAEGAPVRDRLLLFRTVCDAVQHAHQNLVVHRDLKPGNILVDSGGEPKLLDFGIAKLLDPVEDGGVETVAGLRVLTPAYAAPEQLRGEPATTATDVFQLGILLYELLTGVHPLRDGRPAAEGSVRDSDGTVQPSVTFRAGGAGDPAARARARGASPDRLRRELRGDLDAIVLKALRPEADRRYRSVAELTDDLRRHLERRPVRARPDTWAYRTGRFVRRNAVALTVGAGVLVGGVAFAAGIARESRRTAAQRDRAEAVTRYIETLFVSASPFSSDGDDPTVRSLLDEGAARARNELADQPAVQAALLDVVADAYWQIGRTDEGLALRQESLEIWRGLAGASAFEADLTRALARTGRYLVMSGQTDASRPLLEAAEAGLTALPDGAVADRAGVANDLGMAFFALGLHDRAEPHLETAVEGFDVAFAESVSKASALGSLARLRIDRADPDSAEVLFREALAMRREGLGPDHLLVANTLEGMGRLYMQSGQPARADSAYRESLRIREAGLPPGHHLIALVRLGLARARGVTGRPAEADSLFLLAIADLEASSGADHYVVGTARNDRAIFLQNQGRIDEAVQEFAASEALARQAFGEGHLNPSVVGANLAWALFLAGRLDEAVAWYERVLPTLLTRDPSDVQYRANQVDYGIVLCRTDRRAEAVAPLREAVEVFTGTLPDDDRTLRARNALGSCLGALGRYQEAESLLLAVLADTEARPVDDPYRAFARQALVSVYEAWGRPQDARRVASGG